MWLFGLHRWKKRLLQLGFDCFVASLSFILALAIRLEKLDYLYQVDTYIGMLIVIIITLFVFTVQRVYDNLTRYTSMETIFNIAIGSAICGIFLLSAVVLLKLEIPLSVSIIFGIILCIFTSGMRLIISYISQNIYQKKQENIAIYGAGASGIQINDALRKNSEYKVKLFVDDNLELNGKNIAGIPIVNMDHAKEKFQRLKIGTLLLANPIKMDEVRRRVFDLISDYPLKVKSIPSISKLISGNYQINQLKNIKIEDLIGRELVKQNPELMQKNINKKTILVTGAGGSIGSELCRQVILWKPHKLIVMDISEFAIYNLLEELQQCSHSYESILVPLIGSVEDRQFVKRVFDCFKVDTIYHAAAYKHVPLMEQNVMQCITNNVFGTLNIAELAIDAKVKNFTFVSTDKAVNPTNLMGASKRLAEIICQTLSIKKLNTCFSIVRFGNVLGSSGSVVPLFKKQIQRGGPITLTHLEVTRYFMSITEAAQLVIQAGSIAKGGEVFVLDMGKPIKILDLAKRMVTLSGLRPVLNRRKKQNDDEIIIIISGLRPGEKLFEELAYNTNLMGTIHPRINSTLETPMKPSELEVLLTKARDAIEKGDHQKLYHVITKVTDGITDISQSADIFIQQSNKFSNKVVPLHMKNLDI